VVIAASRREAARGRALSNGATATVDLSGADVDGLVTRMRQAAGGFVEVVVDPVCGASATAALQVLGDGGRFVHLGSSGGQSATFSSAVLRGRSQSILGYTNNSLTREQRADALSRVFELAGQGRCHVEHEVIGLDAVADGWKRAGASPDRRIVVVPRIP
jgi:NADPH:quinone reductase-like Zn-dependent oxidoreductase